MSQIQPNEPEIRQTLLDLHEELKQTQTLSDEQRAMMRHLMADIQEMLDRPDGGDPGYKPNPNFLDRLEKSVDLLEISHPNLTVVIKKALDSLSMAGI